MEQSVNYRKVFPPINDLPKTNIIGTNKYGHKLPVILHINFWMLRSCNKVMD